MKNGFKKEVQKLRNSKLGRSKIMHDEIKKLTGKKSSNKPSLSIKDKNGILLDDKDKILERWKEYIGEIFDATDLRCLQVAHLYYEAK